MSGLIVVVTGTDTGVGKTVVACGLARCLARRGVGVVAVKPVESGCGEAPDAGEDGVRLARAAGQAAPRAALVRLRAPVAPPLAADREGRSLDASALCAEIRRLASATEVVLVEGAGGLLSPLTWASTVRDLAGELSAAALVVAPDRLGTLSQARLTLEALGTAGVPGLGVVLTAPERGDESTGTNAEALRRVAGTGRVHTLPRVETPEAAADHLERVADWLEAGS